MKQIEIAGRLVGDGQPCFVIAEAGVNHNGELDVARRLVAAAAAEEADAVKFQQRTVDDILIREVLERPYEGSNSFGRTYGEHRRALELSDNAYRELYKHAQEQGIIFLASGWDPASVEFLDDLGVAAFKVASADLTNLPLLERIARTGKPMLMSTGMSDLEEVARAVNLVYRHHEQVVLLHCVSTYPSDPRDVNLRTMQTLRERFGTLVGYSGHEQGIIISHAAVTLGACVVERHFTLDWTMPGPDHRSSLQPEGLRRLVRGVRKIEVALGSPRKRLLDAERPARERLAKSIVTRRFIPAGTMIVEDMLGIKGPGDGISPALMPNVCGVIAPVDVAEDALLPRDALRWHRPGASPSEAD